MIIDCSVSGFTIEARSALRRANLKHEIRSSKQYRMTQS